MKREDIPYLLLILIVVIILIAVVAQFAEAGHKHDDSEVIITSMYKTLENILEEEVKQTALLAQINCFTFYSNSGQFYGTDDEIQSTWKKLEICDEPLGFLVNYTEEWRP